MAWFDGTHRSALQCRYLRFIHWKFVVFFGILFTILLLECILPRLTVSHLHIVSPNPEAIRKSRVSTLIGQVNVLNNFIDWISTQRKIPDDVIEKFHCVTSVLLTQLSAFDRPSDTSEHNVDPSHCNLLDFVEKSTPASVSIPTTSLETSWFNCTSSPSEPDFLRFCTESFTGDAAEGNILQLLTTSIHHVPSCAASAGACIRILPDFRVPSFHTDIPASLVLLLSNRSITAFQNWHSHSSQMPTYPVVSPVFPPQQFRTSFDILLPFRSYHFLNIPYTYEGVIQIQTTRPHLLGLSVGHLQPVPQGVTETVATRDLIRSLDLDRSLSPIFRLRTFEQHVDCWPTSPYMLNKLIQWNLNSLWFPCMDANELLRNVSFVPILATANEDPIDVGWNAQLVEALQAGAIPVLTDNKRLPLEEAIPADHWDRVVIRIPIRRIRHLRETLSSIPNARLVEMRRQGQLLYQRYLKDERRWIASMLLGLSRRLGFPSPPAPTVSANVVQLVPSRLGDSGSGRATVNPLGQTVYASVATAVSTPLDPFWSYPSTPWDPTDPVSQTPKSFSSTSSGFGLSTVLDEQFTVVILTYDRYRSLCQTLKSLLDLPSLHSVVVVWNNLQSSPADLKWPRIHVPIKLVQSEKNSLNNRFLPLDIIETEAVFSLDDDIILPHNDILTAFRTWRENRDRIVGFPARSRVWDSVAGTWTYHYEEMCNYSMILTGAAFYHKYYAYTYTSEMPASVRQTVDEMMNCEDIAFNFWVVHISRRPPIRVNYQTQFGCVLCGSGLSFKHGHLETRARCISVFTMAFGYNPLLDSTVRAVAQPLFTAQQCGLRT